MHPFGLITFLQVVWEHGLPSLFVLIALGLLLSVTSLNDCHQRHQDAPVALPGLPFFNVTTFLKRRHDFLAWGFRVTNQRLFQFRLLRVRQNLFSHCYPRDDDFPLWPSSGIPPRFTYVEQRCCRVWRARAEGFFLCEGTGPL
jgi:hypothetical protein